MYDDEHNETPAEQEVELEVPSPAEAEDQSYDEVVERAVENMNRIHGEDESSAQEAEPVVEATEVVEPEAAEPAVTNDAAAVEPDSATDDFVYETGKEPNEEDLAGLDVINEDDEGAEDTQEAKDEAPEIIVEDVEWVEVPPHNNNVEEENALVLAENAARGAHRSIMDGFTAFKTVREATQRHIDAREALQGMQDQLDEHMAQLKHRIDIEEAYPQIVSEQTATIEEAKTASQQALKRAETLDGERTGLESDLESMKVRHEDELRPYRNVAAATKSRADDATLVLDEAKRATKNAEQALSDATRWRDERISSVNRSVDNAQERLRQMTSELEELKKSENVQPEAIKYLEDEIATEKAHLKAASDSLPKITEDTRKTVEEAQARVFAQKREQEQAEQNAATLRQAADEKRGEYDNVLKRTQDEEHNLSARIKQNEADANQARVDANTAQLELEAARSILDEAEAIHSTPQDTINLRNQVAHEQADLDHQQDEVETLASNERELRRSTLKSRVLLVVSLVIAALLVIGIIVALVNMSRKPTQTTPTPTQTQSTQTNSSSSDKDKEKEKDSSSYKDKETPSSSSSSSSSSSNGTSSDQENESSKEQSTSGTSSTTQNETSTDSSSSSSDSNSSSTSSNSSSSSNSSNSSSSSSSSYKDKN